jgi:DNA-binding transcriptional ArsR family regulator
MKWIGLVAIILFVIAILVDAVRYRLARRKVIGLLRQRGPMSGLELSQAGIPRAHVYLLLNRLEDDGVVESFVVGRYKHTPDVEQRKYKLLKRV